MEIFRKLDRGSIKLRGLKIKKHPVMPVPRLLGLNMEGASKKTSRRILSVFDPEILKKNRNFRRVKSAQVSPRGVFRGPI